MSLVLLFHFFRVNTLYIVCRETILSAKKINFEKSGARFAHSHDGKGFATQFLGSMVGEFLGVCSDTKRN